MKKIGKIIHLDMKRLGQSVVAVVVIMGLCLVPSLYAWFNILSNWDPYGPASTSNIKVAVANEDDGAELLGMTLNIGEMVMDRLKDLDSVAYVRFASVYREFKDVNTFLSELKKMLGN